MRDNKFKLNKTVFTDEDFDNMKWHDCRIHSIGFYPDEYEVAFDIDYIFEWEKPESNETHFKLWISPATLVFHNINDLEISVEPSRGLNVDFLERTDPREPKNLKYLQQKKHEWLWKMGCMEGEIKMYSVGYSLFVRRPPKLFTNDSPLGTERRIISFDREFAAE